MTKNLTAQVKAGGCASKLSPKILEQVLGKVPRSTDPNVLVGFDTSDDAGVYRLDERTALVQTTDFFTPVVDDPFTFGAISAANALSDVYAMGGRPLTSLTILCYPAKGDLEDLGEILAGGASKMLEAGCVILGGHSVADDEIKFGYAVTGVVDPDRVKPNAGARVGDVLVFTKKIGTGAISTALKRGIADAAHVEAATMSMLTLNREACEKMLAFAVHGCTDVSGFGLLGHAREMALASGVTLIIESARVPQLPGALEYTRAGAIPGGGKNNRDFVSECVEGSSGDSALDDLLYDPQTSGGLLITMPEADAVAYAAAFPAAVRIGTVIERARKPLRVV